MIDPHNRKNAINRVARINNSDKMQSLMQFKTLIKRTIAGDSQQCNLNDLEALPNRNGIIYVI